MRAAVFSLASLLSAAMGAAVGDNDVFDAVAVLTIVTTGVTGNFTFTATSLADPLEITVYLAGLNSSEFYDYHIHEKPVDAAAGCASAGIHLDPAAVGQGGNVTGYTCDKSDFSLCELGDLSGKFGSIFPENATFPFTVTDPSEGMADPGQPSRYIAGRSMVVHDSSGKRVSCGNINVGNGRAADAADTASITTADTASITTAATTAATGTFDGSTTTSGEGGISATSGSARDLGLGAGAVLGTAASAILFIY